MGFFFINAQLLCFARDARSVQSGNQPVQIIFENQSDLPLKIQWIDFEGQPQDYGVIPAGKTVPYESYPGHSWQFVVDRQTIGSYRATTADRQTFTLSGGGAVPVPTKSTGQGGTSQPLMNDTENGLFQ